MSDSITVDTARLPLLRILLFGPSGSGKSHLGAALGHALVENVFRRGILTP